MKKWVLVVVILIASASTAWAQCSGTLMFSLYNGAAIVGKYSCRATGGTHDIVAGQTRTCCGGMWVGGPGFRGDSTPNVPSGCRASQDQLVKVKLTGTIFKSGINWWCENR